MQPSVAGSLLIASATLVDPNFARCVIWILDSDANGSLGVVLNRPSQTTVGDVLEPWQDMTTAPDVFFQGGPVELNAALAVGSLRTAAATGPGIEPPPSGWQPLPAVSTGTVGMVDLDGSPQDFLGRLGALRVYAGYTGWGAGQLEGEIEQGSWHVVPAVETDLFSSSPDQLWGRVLRRQPSPLSLLSTLPEDVSLN